MNRKIAFRFFSCAVTVAFFLPLSAQCQSSVNEVPSFIDASDTDSGSGTPAAESPNATEAPAALPDAPQAQTTPQTPPVATDPTLNTGQQTKRILFIIPNFRAASVDAKLPPMTAKEEIKLVLQDSFDYSSFLYVGIVAGIGQMQNSYPAFRQGAAGYGRYYWHSFADSVGENAFTEFLVPYATRQDPRYYTLGRGGFPKRMVYSVSRLLICRDNNANETFNFSEVVGAGASAGLSNTYYPSQYTSWTKTGQKWITQIGIDGLGNIAKEFWPDVNAHLFNNKF
jgi:hypothetical protein